MKNLFVLFMCFLSVLYPATCTSSVAGDFNTAGNWSCGHVPVNGDSAVVNHDMTTSGVTAFGLDGATGTAALTINTGKSLIINNEMTLRGDLIQQRGSTVDARANIILDANTGVTYNWGTNITGTGVAQVKITGTSGSWVTVTKGARGGIGSMITGTTTNVWSNVNLQYARLVGLGSASVRGLEHYTAQPGVGILLRDVLFLNSSVLYIRNATSTSFYDLERVTIIGPIATTDAISINTSTDKGTGERRIVNLSVWSESLSKLVNTVLARDTVITNMFTHNTPVQGNGTDARRQVYTNLFVTADLTGNGVSFFGNNGNAIRGSIFYTRSYNPHHITDSVNGTGNTFGSNVVENNVCDGDSYLGGSDWGEFMTPGSAIIVRNNLLVNVCGNLFSTASVTASITADNNTMYQAYKNNVAETNGAAGQIASYRNNLMVDLYGSASGAVVGMNVGRGLWQHIGGVFVPQSAMVLDNNAWYQPSSNTMDPTNLSHPVHGLSYMGPQSYGAWWSNSTVYGTAASYGANDFKVNPGFVDPTRTIRKWVGARLGVDTSAWTYKQVVAKIFEYASGFDTSGNPVVNPVPLLANDALEYMRAGFVPQEQSIWQGGYDKTTVGGVSADAIRGSVTAAAIF